MIDTLENYTKHHLKYLLSTLKRRAEDGRSADAMWHGRATSLLAASFGTICAAVEHGYLYSSRKYVHEPQDPLELHYLRLPFLTEMYQLGVAPRERPKLRDYLLSIPGVKSTGKVTTPFEVNERSEHLHLYSTSYLTLVGSELQQAVRGARKYNLKLHFQSSCRLQGAADSIGL